MFYSSAKTSKVYVSGILEQYFITPIGTSLNPNLPNWEQYSNTAEQIKD